MAKSKHRKNHKKALGVYQGVCKTALATYEATLPKEVGKGVYKAPEVDLTQALDSLVPGLPEAMGITSPKEFVLDSLSSFPTTHRSPVRGANKLIGAIDVLSHYQGELRQGMKELNALAAMVVEDAGKTVMPEADYSQLEGRILAQTRMDIGHGPEDVIISLPRTPENEAALNPPGPAVSMSCVIDKG